MNRDKMEPNEPVALVTTRNGVWDDPTERASASAVQKRDAEWRAAVEREMWTEHSPFCDRSGIAGCCGMAARNSALDALLAAMEGK